MSCENPLQNSVEQGVEPGPAPSPPCSQVTPGRPSGQPPTLDISDNDEKTFFDNSIYKKHYFQICKALAKQEKSLSRIWFLRKCVNLEILPNTSVIKANPNVRFSNVASEAIQANLQNVSLRNLKIGICEENKHLELCKKLVRDNKISLHNIIKEANLHSFLAKRLSLDSVKFKKQFYNVHKNKLCFLLQKNNKPIPRDLRASSDPPGHNSAKKKSRKFVNRNKYRRRIKLLNKNLNTLVINYSDIELSKDMTSLLNRGLNFAVMPKSINTTDIHAGFQKLGRSMKWREHLYKDDDIDSSVVMSNYSKEPWRKAKLNLPNSAPPADLNTFLNGSLNCVLGSDLNKVQSNLPESEKRAMNELIQLQKSRVITLKPHDKCGGTAVLNTSDYIKSMDLILDSKFIDSDGVEHPYFQKLDHNQASQLMFNHLDDLKSKVNEAERDNIITTDIANWLIPDDYSPGRLYGLVKNHVSGLQVQQYHH